MSDRNILKITVFALVIIVGTMFLLRACGPKQESTTTKTETKVVTVTPPPARPTVPDPTEAHIEDLIAKGVELDSLKQALRHVASRYTHYKGETLRLRAELDTLRNLALMTEECAERELIYLSKIEKLRGRNADLDGLIDSLFAGMAQAGTVRTYTFEEKDEYQERTTDITVVGYLPPGGYQYSTRYFLPETTTTTTITEAHRRHALLGLGGLQLDGGTARPAYGLGYLRTGRQLGLGAQGIYLPSTNKLSGAVQLMGSLSVHF